MTIAVDVLSIHYDVDLYGPVDPNEFYPLRFAPENKRNPLAFLAFGIGPRNCIGMKFALIELKIGLIKLLLNYEIKPGKWFPEKMQFNEGLVRTPKDGVNVLFTKREASLLRD
jgi:cytochrome P450